MDVAEIDDALAVEAARDHGAVHEDAGLIAQTVAEALAFVFLFLQVRPFELVVVIQVDAFGELDALAPRELVPDAEIEAEFALEPVQYVLIALTLDVRRVILGQVPQPQRDQHVRRRDGFLDERQHFAEIAFLVDRAFVAVEAVQREIDLPQRRLAEDFGARFMQQRAVRGEVHLEAAFMGQVEQHVDLGMQQGLAFDVKINMVGMRPDLVQRLREIVDGDEALRALGRRAEGAGQVADARDFDIKFFESFHAVVSPVSFVQPVMVCDNIPYII